MQLAFLCVLFFQAGFCLSESYSSHNVSDAVNIGVSWLLRQRNDEWSWGPSGQNARSIITLNLADAIDPNNAKTYISVKEMNLDLLKALSHDPDLDNLQWYGGRLALYISGLAATCQNPHNFYGHDLIKILKSHMNGYPKHYFNHLFSYGLAVIALCNSEESVDLKYQEVLLNNSADLKFDHGLDEASMALLAITCLQGTPRIRSVKSSLASHIEAALTTSTTSTTSTVNSYTASNVLQALYSADETFDQRPAYEKVYSKLVESVLSKMTFRNILEAYHVIPVLLKKSYLDTKCQRSKVTTVPPVEGLSIKVKITIVAHKTSVEVYQAVAPQNSTLLDVMRASSLNFEGHSTTHGFLVTSINGVMSGPAKKTYWHIRKGVYGAQDTTALTTGVSSYRPHDGDSLIFLLTNYSGALVG